MSCLSDTEVTNMLYRCNNLFATQIGRFTGGRLLHRMAVVRSKDAYRRMTTEKPRKAGRPGSESRSHALRTMQVAASRTDASGPEVALCFKCRSSARPAQYEDLQPIVYRVRRTRDRGS